MNLHVASSHPLLLLTMVDSLASSFLWILDAALLVQAVSYWHREGTRRVACLKKWKEYYRFLTINTEPISFYTSLCGCLSSDLSY